MLPLRLIGLFLFVTSIFLSLMAVATRTSHIDVKRPDSMVASEQGQQTAKQSGPATPLQFVSVPIVYPLAGVGAFGLLIWFIPSITFSKKKPAAHKKSSRRKSPKARAA